MKKKDFLLIFLHGFLGNASDWEIILEDKRLSNYNKLAIDLPGHGNFIPVNTVNNYSEDIIICYIKDIIKSQLNKKIILIGYSLGARAALSFVCKYPELVNALVLESGTPGIEDPAERINRFKTDNILAKKIKEDYNNFIIGWYNTAIFSSLSFNPDLKELLTLKRYNNNPNEIIKALIGFSQGIMIPRWELLKDLNIPILLISGELDKKYTEINKKMQQLLPKSIHKEIKNAGHIPHFENKYDFIKELDYFLETL